ncbi:MAG: response regulator transcription factor [Solirubrobacterales bacterium]
MTGEAESIEIVVADDHPVVRSGLRSVLAEHGDMEVVGEAADAEETIRKVNAFKPDVLVLDLMMPGGPTVDSISELRKISPDTQIIVLTMQSDPAYARTALREGASGFILKEAAKDTLADAVRKVAAGGTYVDPVVGVRLAREPEFEGPPDGLSGREAQVLGLVALGHTNHEIADRLFISVRTVEAHRTHIQQKISFGSRAELVRYALDHGLAES